MLSLMGDSLPLRAQNPSASSDPDLYVPEKPGAVSCVKCPNPANCVHDPLVPVCPEPDYSGDNDRAAAHEAGKAATATGPESRASAHDGRAPGGSLQGSTPMTAAAAADGYGVLKVSSASRYGNFPAVSFSSWTYGAGGAAVLGQPLAGQGRGGPISAGDQDESSEPAAARASRQAPRGPGLAEPKDGGRADDWARRLVEAWKSGDEKTAVQGLLEGMDADAAQRGGAAYGDAVARKLLQAMGRDAAAIARLLGSESHRGYQEHFEQACQAGARGDIDRARAEFAWALAALLGGPGGRRERAGLLIVVSLGALVAVVVLAKRRRRESRGSPA